MAITTKSKLKPAILMSVTERNTLEQLALDLAEQKALLALGADAPLTARALLPSDLAETNEVWANQLGSSGNAYENSIIASQSIANDTWIGVYGLVDTSIAMFHAAIRWTIGSRKAALWSVFDYFTEDERLDARTAYALSPLVITKSQSVTIELYKTGAAGAEGSVHIAYLGWVVEKAGKTIDVS